MSATFAMNGGINRIRKCHCFDEISSLAAPEVVTLTTSGTASDENFHQNDDISISVFTDTAHMTSLHNEFGKQSIMIL